MNFGSERASPQVPPPPPPPLPLLCSSRALCRRGVPGLVPHPAAHVPGHGGHQRGRHRSLLHPGGQRLRPAAGPLRDGRVGPPGGPGTLAALLDLETLAWGGEGAAGRKEEEMLDSRTDVSDTGATGDAGDAGGDAGGGTVGRGSRLWHSAGSADLKGEK